MKKLAAPSSDLWDQIKYQKNDSGEDSNEMKRRKQIGRNVAVWNKCIEKYSTGYEPEELSDLKGYLNDLQEIEKDHITDTRSTINRFVYVREKYEEVVLYAEYGDESAGLEALKDLTDALEWANRYACNGYAPRNKDLSNACNGYAPRNKDLSTAEDDDDDDGMYRCAKEPLTIQQLIEEDKDLMDDLFSD